jgi:hypothetical protein
VLLDEKSIWALGWIGGNRILPKHVWKPIVTGAIAPKSGMPWDPTTFAPDPDLIGSGPWRLDEYVPYSHILLQANEAGSVVDTGITADPNENSQPINSTEGYFRFDPIHVDIHADDYRAKIDPGFPNTSIDVNLTVSTELLLQVWWMFVNSTALDLSNPIGAELQGMWPPYTSANGGVADATLRILSFVDQNTNGVLDAGDIIVVEEIAPNPSPPLDFYAKNIAAVGNQWRFTLEAAVEGDLTVELNGVTVLTQHQNLTSKGLKVRLKKVVPQGPQQWKLIWIMVRDQHVCWNCRWTHKWAWVWVFDPPYPIWVTIPEDITGSYYVNPQLLAPDCKVDLKDVFLAGKAFGSIPGDAKWSPYADVNHDYKIDLKDYFAVCKKFGKW